MAHQCEECGTVQPSLWNRFVASISNFWYTRVQVPWWKSRMEAHLKKNEEIFDSALQRAMQAKLDEVRENGYDDAELGDVELMMLQHDLDVLSDENLYLKTVLGQALDQGFKLKP